ncbi:CybS, succinate dehydrogenase cytochrome B small subunit [Nakaseomyces glabratus]|nr:CybS, succinate dehydrogenase cytochrome B small subunit [Nakaseomyces glabratus]
MGGDDTIVKWQVSSTSYLNCLLHDRLGDRDFYSGRNIIHNKRERTMMRLGLMGPRNANVYLRRCISHVRFNSVVSSAKDAPRTTETHDKELSAEMKGPQMYKCEQPTQPEDSFQNDYHKYINYTLLPLTVGTFGSVIYTGEVHPMLDFTISSLFLFSTHYHFTSLILDYIPKEKFKRLHKMAMYLLYSATGFGLFGIYELETSNNGVVDLVRKLWSEDDSQIFFRK